VYTEGLVEETAYLLAEWLASQPVQGSVAFPELVVPLVVVLRKAIKAAKSSGGKSGSSSGKDVGVVKGLVERIEDSGEWVEQKRKGVMFSPGMLAEVEEWESRVKVEESPLGKYVKVQRKAREKRRMLVDKVGVPLDSLSAFYSVLEMLNRQERVRMRLSWIRYIMDSPWILGVFLILCSVHLKTGLILIALE